MSDQELRDERETKQSASDNEFKRGEKYFARRFQTMVAMCLEEMERREKYDDE